MAKLGLLCPCRDHFLTLLEVLKPNKTESKLCLRMQFSIKIINTLQDFGNLFINAFPLVSKLCTYTMGALRVYATAAGETLSTQLDVATRVTREKLHQECWSFQSIQGTKFH